MRLSLLPGIVAVLSIVSVTAYAGEPRASDIEIISVLPRSPDVKPFAISVPADGHRATATLASAPGAAPADTAQGKLASVQKPVAASTDDKQ